MNLSFLEEALIELSKERPKFFSESDFQFSLAWKIKEMGNGFQVRLEKPITIDGIGFRLDILLMDNDSKKIGIELKYLKDKFEGEIDEEPHKFKKSYTYGGSRYNFLNDIHRLERLKMNGNINIGYAILLTNVKNCYSEKTKSSRYVKILLHEGRELKKDEVIKLDDKPKYPPFTLLANHNPFCWKPYSDNDGFKYLIVQI